MPGDTTSKEPDQRAGASWATFRDKLLSGALWNVLATVASQGAIFVTNVVLANQLGIAEFGSFALMLSTMMAITGIAQAGVGLVATKYVAELRFSAPDRAGRVMALCRLASAFTGVVGTIAVAVSAPLISGVFMERPVLGPMLAAFSPYVLFSVLNTYQVGALYGFGAFRQVSIYGAIHGLAHLVLCAGATATAGLEGAIAAFAASAMLRWGLFGFLLHHVSADAVIVPSRRGALGEMRLLRDFAVPAAVSGLTTLPAVWFANLMLSRQPDGTEQVGAYQVATQLRLLALQLPLVLNSVTLSVLNQQRGRDDRHAYQSVFWTNLWTTVLAAVVVALLLGVFRGEVLGLFGRDFVRADTLALVLLASTLPEIVAVATYQHIQSEARMWLSLFAVALPRDLAFVGLSWLLAQEFAAVGVSLAYFCAWTIACASILFIASRMGFGISTSRH